MLSEPRAVVVLGMHRSGTSCLAGMLAAGKVASAGDAIRNWDNARGHHEMLDAVRLDEAVLAHNGGHWLAPPAHVHWTPGHAEARDGILGSRIAGLPALIKDPRALLVLPMWRASTVPFHAIGIVRHPLAVARSLESWRGMPLDDGVALWQAHNRALAADRQHHDYPLVDFDAPKATVVAAVIQTCETWGVSVEEAAVAEAYADELVHHDRDDVPDVPGLDEAIALYEQLAARARTRTRTVEPAGGAAPRHRFPRRELAAFEAALRDGDPVAAAGHARAAIGATVDIAAVLVPVVTTLVRARAFAPARELVGEAAGRVGANLVELLHGKILLAMGDAVGAIAHLEAACTAPSPFFQSRQLLPQALWQAGRRDAARHALAEVAELALYPHGPLATLAEWSFLDGDLPAAIAEMTRAVAAAPIHRSGRLRTRLAEWLIVRGDRDEARRQLEQAAADDPAYTRSRTVLASLR